MPDLSTRLAAAWRLAGEHAGLAVVPALVAFLSVRNVRRVVSFSGVQFGVAFGLPTPVPSVWTAVSLPTQPTGGVSVEPAVLAAVPVVVLLRAVVAAGFLGSLREVSESGAYDFPANVRRYVVQFLLYDAAATLLVTGSALLIAGGVFAGGVALTGLAVVGVLGFVALGYLFWAAPFLVVTRDTDVVSALRGSFALATAGGPYLAYSVGYLAVVIALSIPTTLVVVNLGIVGVLLGAVAFAPVGLTLALATVRFVADVDAESVDLGSWDDSGAGGTTRV
jgi:hypothetical protein